MNILHGDLINHIRIMIYGYNRVNNEMDNIDCDTDVDFKKYADKHIKIVSH